MAAPLRTVAGSGGDPLTEAIDEAIELTKRLKLPYIRRSLTDLIPTAKAQRWDPAEVVRVLLAEEAAGRDTANLRTRRKRAAFPAGKTFGDWDEHASTIPRPTQDALKTLEWVQRKENLCICGPSGTGKSHFCEALGQAAVEAGMSPIPRRGTIWSYTISYLVPINSETIVPVPDFSTSDRKINLGWDNGPRLYMTGPDFWNLGKIGLQEMCGKLPWGSVACNKFVERLWTGNLTGPGRILNDSRCWDLSQTLNVGWRPASPEKCA